MTRLCLTSQPFVAPRGSGRPRRAVAFGLTTCRAARSADALGRGSRSIQSAGTWRRSPRPSSMRAFVIIHAQPRCCSRRPGLASACAGWCYSRPEFTATRCRRRSLYVVSSGTAGVTATLAAALAPIGATVNCVNPGPNDTGYADSGNARVRCVPHMPLARRWGQPADIARTGRVPGLRPGQPGLPARPSTRTAAGACARHR